MAKNLALAGMRLAKRCPDRSVLGVWGTLGEAGPPFGRAKAAPSPSRPWSARPPSRVPFLTVLRNEPRSSAALNAMQKQSAAALTSAANVAESIDGAFPFFFDGDQRIPKGPDLLTAPGRSLAPVKVTHTVEIRGLRAVVRFFVGKAGQRS